jgi:hypothetical protein
MRKYLLALCSLLATLSFSTNAFAIKVGAFSINPFLAVTERYTDNVFNTNSDAKSDFSTVISPGIRFIFPRVTRRYHLEAVYQADFERFNRYAAENNADNHKVDAKFDIGFPVGLDFHASDDFRRSHDPRGVSLGPELDFYKDNLFSAGVSYSLTDRFMLEFDYSNYILNYDAERNNFRNRTDNSLAGYIYYRFMPKTSAFLEYEYVIVDFKEAETFNSTEHHLYGGVTWDVTGKTRGTVKAGYGIKDFDDPSITGYKGYIMQVSVDHNFSSRDSVKITGSRATNETNQLGADYFVTTFLSAEYFHRLTGKITATGNVGYARDSYRGISRDDDTWTAGAGLSYQFKRWLLSELGYSYTKRSSTDNDFTYRNNTIFLRIVGTL